MNIVDGKTPQHFPLTLNVWLLKSGHTSLNTYISICKELTYTMYLYWEKLWSFEI